MPSRARPFAFFIDRPKRDTGGKVARQAGMKPPTWRVQKKLNPDILKDFV